MPDSICQFFLRGQCSRSRCEFLHPADATKIIQNRERDRRDQREREKQSARKHAKSVDRADSAEQVSRRRSSEDREESSGRRRPRSRERRERTRSRSRSRLTDSYRYHDRDRFYSDRLPVSEVPCKFFLGSGCKFGSACKFKHPRRGSRSPPRYTSAVRRSPSPRRSPPRYASPSLRRMRSPLVGRSRSPSLRRMRSPPVGRSRSPSTRRMRSPPVGRSRSPSTRRMRSPPVRKNTSLEARPSGSREEERSTKGEGERSTKGEGERSSKGGPREGERNSKGAPRRFVEYPSVDLRSMSASPARPDNKTTGIQTKEQVRNQNPNREKKEGESAEKQMTLAEKHMSLADKKLSLAEKQMSPPETRISPKETAERDLREKLINSIKSKTGRPVSENPEGWHRGANSSIGGGRGTNGGAAERSRSCSEDSVGVPKPGSRCRTCGQIMVSGC